MAVVVIDTIKPKNQGTFPIVEAADVKVTNDKRLDAALNDKANQSDLTALQTTVSGKASQTDLTALSETVSGKQNALTEEQLTACNSGITSELVTQIGTNTTAIATKASAADVATADANLQAQIDNIVTPVTQDAEVQNARVGSDGSNYISLKSRLDSETLNIASEINDINTLLDVEQETATVQKSTKSYWWKDSDSHLQRDVDARTTFFYPEAGKKYIINAVDSNRFTLIGISTYFDITEDVENLPDNISGTKLYEDRNTTSFTWFNNTNYAVIGIMVGSGASYHDATAYINKVTGYESDTIEQISINASDIIDINNNISDLKETLKVHDKETAITDKITKFYGWTAATGRFSQDSNLRTTFFHAEQGKTYNIHCKNSNRFVLVGISESLDFSESPEFIYGTSIIADNTITDYQYTNTEGYLTFGVYVGNGATNARADIYEFEGEESELEPKVNAAYQLVNNPIIIGSPETYFADALYSTYTDGNDYAVESLYALYDDLCTRYPDIIVRQADLGKDETDTYTIRRYTLCLNKKYSFSGEPSEPGGYINPGSLTNYWKNDYNSPTAVLNSGMHGNEKAPCLGMALAIKDIVESSDKWATFIKSNLTIEICPCLNPYGFAHDQRRNANNVDINRDFNSDTKQAETEALITLFERVKDNDLSFFLDVHGSSGYYAYTETNMDTTEYDKFYPIITYKLASAMYNNWKSFWVDNFNINATPFIYHTRSTHSGTVRDYAAQYNIPMLTLETPQDIAHGNTNSYNNDLRTCKITKDLVINLLQDFISVSDKSRAIVKGE